MATAVKPVTCAFVPAERKNGYLSINIKENTHASSEDLRDVDHTIPNITWTPSPLLMQ